MDRTIYRDGVEVTQDQLQHTESTKAEHIRRRLRDTSSTGVVEGLATTCVVSGGANVVRIGAGAGYASGGELVELAATTDAVPSSTTNGERLLAGVLYGESLTRPAASTLDGTAQTTRAVANVTVLAPTETEYESWPESDDENLSSPARGRFLITAVIDVDTVWASSTVTSPIGLTGTTSLDILSIDQPGSPPAGTAITGLVVTAIDPDTVVTDDASSPTTATVAYNSTTGVISYTPPDGTVGTSADVRGQVDGASVTVTAGSGETITLAVYPSLLPTATSPSASGLVVSRLYEPRARRLSAKDEMHRRYQGSGIPTATNPHGLRFGDLEDQIVDVPFGLVLGTELLGSAADHLVPRRVVDLLALTPAAFVLVDQYRVPDTSPDRYFRTYFMPADHSSANVSALVFTTNALWTVGGWVQDDAAEVSHKWHLGGNGFEVFSKAAGGGTWADNAWTNNPGLGLYPAIDGGTLTVGPDVTLRNTADPTAGSGLDAHLTVIAALGATRAPLLHSEYTGDVASPVRVYRASSTGTSGGAARILELTGNARWDGTTWSKDVTASPAWKLQVEGTGALRLLTQVTNAATFTDTVGVGGWDSEYLDFIGGVLRASSHIRSVTGNIETLAGNINSAAAVSATTTVTAGTSMTAGTTVTAGTNMVATVDHTYASAKSWARTFPFSSFPGALDTTSYHPTTPWLQTDHSGSTTNGFFQIPLSGLPDGGTLTQFGVTCSTDGALGGTMTYRLIRITHSTAAVSTIASATTTGTANLATYTTLLSGVVAEVIDLSTYTYLLQVEPGDTATDVRHVSARFVGTLTALKP